MFTDQYLQSCRTVTVHGSKFFMLQKNMYFLIFQFDKKLTALLFIAALIQTQYSLPTTAEQFFNGKTYIFTAFKQALIM